MSGFSNKLNPTEVGTSVAWQATQLAQILLASCQPLDNRMQFGRWPVFGLIMASSPGGYCKRSHPTMTVPKCFLIQKPEAAGAERSPERVLPDEGVPGVLGWGGAAGQVSLLLIVLQGAEFPPPL